MVDRDANVEEHCGNDHHINERQGKDVADVAWNDIFPYRYAQSFVALAKFCEKDDAFLIDRKAIFFGETGILYAERLVELFHFFEKCLDL